MSPVRLEAFEEQPPARCEFEMPENSMGLDVGARCCRDAGHSDADHVIAAPTRGAVTYWAIEPGNRLAKALMHADTRDGTTLDDEEAQVLWAYMELLRQREEGATT